MANAATADEGKVLYPLSLVGILLAMLFGFAVLPRLFTPSTSPFVGKDAPDFTLDLVANGETAQISLADLKGKPVLLDFWATWCGPCQAEAPVVNKVAQRFKDKGLVVVGVNTSDSPGRAAPWIKAHGITFPIAYDPDVVAPKYGVENLPTLVLLSKEGKVLAIRTGVTTDAELERLVTAAL
jgi:cytochrome c biogenesis protein CcmG, thiol:disulfide interchange protein DsbE